MKQSKKNSPQAVPDAIHHNRGAQEGRLPPAVRDLADLLAELAFQRLQSAAPQHTGAQEPHGD
jgi:hypothetical protein